MDSGNSVFVGNFVFNMLMTASLHHIWSMVNAQQLVVMTGLFGTTFPANLNIFFRYLMSIAAFDVIELTEFNDNFFENEPTGPYS